MFTTFNAAYAWTTSTF